MKSSKKEYKTEDIKLYFLTRANLTAQWIKNEVSGIEEAALILGISEEEAEDSVMTAAEIILFEKTNLQIVGSI